MAEIWLYATKGLSGTWQVLVAGEDEGSIYWFLDLLSWSDTNSSSCFIDQS